MTSLRARLVLYLLVPFVLLLPLTATLNYFIGLVPMRNALDHGLERIAVVVAGYVKEQGGAPRLALSREIEATLYGEQIGPVPLALIGPNGELIEGDPVLAGVAPHTAAGQVQVFDFTGEGAPLRVAAYGLPCGAALCQVRVGEPVGKREALERNILLGAWSGTLILLALVAVVTVVGTRQSLEPVARLRRQMQQRSLDDLAPVDGDDLPEELTPLVEAINRLLRRLHEAASSHHQFIANAAHQLRTPLASLLARIELARKAAPEAPGYAEELGHLQQAVERMARVTAQLLLLARSDAGAHAALALRPLDLKDLAADAARAWVPRAVERDVDLGFDLAPAPVQGEPQLLRELLDNLIDNALLHGGRRLTVRTMREAQMSLLEVEDDGPGIAAAERERVFERFVRGTAARGSGSGLGLPIVRQIAQRHGAAVELAAGENGRGLCVRLRFVAGPRAAAPSVS